MTFWSSRLHQDAAVVDLRSSRTLSYAQLCHESDALAALFGVRREKRLGFVLCDNALGALAAYLAALRVGDAVCLVASTVEPAVLERLVASYEPDWLAAPEGLAVPVDYQPTGSALQTIVYARARCALSPIHPELALLLSTSGTTGSAKMVRLSFQALDANAAAIAQYLGLTAEERPILSLPMHYSYGLSVINSHLRAGGTLLLGAAAVTTREFWEQAQSLRATSLAGVPYTYEMLRRLELQSLAPDSMKVFTQAGGRLKPQLIEHFAALARARAGRFYVMYGQTEATARISYLPPERVSAKLGSIGVAIPGGELDLSDVGELVYRGPNVMLGYAERRADLARGDELLGILRTGDLGARDSDGDYYLTGRMKRISKLFGLRINLDDVDALLASELPCSAACAGSDAELAIAVEDQSQLARARELVVKTYRLHASVVRASFVPALPRTPHGKIDYAALEALVAR